MLEFEYAAILRGPSGGIEEGTQIAASFPGASEASRFGLLLPGLPGTDPGHFFPGEKVTHSA